jgi:hypothetical protein
MQEKRDILFYINLINLVFGYIGGIAVHFMLSGVLPMWGALAVCFLTGVFSGLISFRLGGKLL